MKHYTIYLRHPFFKVCHETDAENMEQAIENVRSRYNVTDERHRKLYIITAIFEVEKVAEELPLF